MNRNAALSLTLLAALAGGCDESSDEVTTPIGAVAIYSPSSGLVPLPNDLLFSGSVDGTLNAPAPSNPAQVPLFDAINALDGWSTTSPISIAFSETIDPATVTPASVRMFEVTTAGLTTGNAVTGVASELTFGVDFVATAAPGNTAIVILPLAPLAGAENYMVVVTNAVKATDGAAAQRSIVYDLASDTAPLADHDPLKPLQGLVGAMQTAAAGQGIAKASIIISFTFQTQSIGTVLGTVTNLVAGAEAAVIAGLCGVAPVDCSDTTPDPNLVASVGGFQQIAAVATTQDLVDVYQGELTVPYFLTAAAAGGAGPDDLTQDTAPLTTWWNSRFDWLAPGVDDPNHVTALNPLPATTGQVTVPVLVTTPKGAKPPGGWPVVIFQHGIGGNRTILLGNAGLVETDPSGSPGVFEQVLADTSIADAFAGAGFACIAIDLPLHGIDPGNLFGDPEPSELFVGFETASDELRERTFGLDLANNLGLPVPDGFADPSGTHYINLTSLRSTRDNTRQAVSDLLHLLDQLDQVDIVGASGPDGTPDFDATDVHFVGHSLGAIVGGVFLQFAPAIRTIQSATLGMPGGQLAYLLQNSVNFGPSIDAGLAQFGLFPGSAEYDLFFVAAQTLADSADPINYTDSLVVDEGAPAPTPIHLVEVIGEAPTALPDQTVPNSAATAPLAGTEPYITALGLTSVQTDLTSGPIYGAVRFLRGYHSSLPFPSLTTAGEPDLDATNAEMLGQMVEFATTNGTMLTLVNETIIETGP